MDQAPRMAFSHIGLYVANIASMVSFYTDVLGFSITDQAHIRGADVVFLSRNPDEHHQIVLVPDAAHRVPRRSTKSRFGSCRFLNCVAFMLSLSLWGLVVSIRRTTVDLGLCTS